MQRRLWLVKLHTAIHQFFAFISAHGKSHNCARNVSGTAMGAKALQQVIEYVFSVTSIPWPNQGWRVECQTSVWILVADHLRVKIKGR